MATKNSFTDDGNKTWPVVMGQWVGVSVAGTFGGATATVKWGDGSTFTAYADGALTAAADKVFFAFDSRIQVEVSSAGESTSLTVSIQEELEG